MRAESQLKECNVIKKGMGQKRTPALTMAKTINAEGKRVQHTMQELVEAATHRETSHCFSQTGTEYPNLQRADV